MEIKKYEPSLRDEWNQFIEESRNGTFLLNRNFMEYHSDRFIDHSLLFYDQAKLIAVLPANIKGTILYSHQGLTYGGIIQAERTTVAQVRKVVDVLIEYLRSEEIEKLIYKPVPHIYHRYPSEEDLYALFQVGAKLHRRSIGSTIILNKKMDFDNIRKRALKRAIKYNYVVKEEDSFSAFWKVLEDNLRNRHGAKPVHTLEEIEYLHSKFPENIRMFSTFTPENELEGGALIFETETIARLQYCSTNAGGRKYGALDILFDHLINNVFQDKEYFDFGTSTEDEGHVLNEGLIFQKEGLGGRATAFDTYELIIE